MAILSYIKDGVTIPLSAPVGISVGDELIWSSNTGRISTGKMLGDVIAEKKTLSVTWEFLKASELNSIRTGLTSGFFSLVVNIDGEPITLESYRGTLTSEAMGQLDDGIYYFRSASVDLVEQ